MAKENIFGRNFNNKTFTFLTIIFFKIILLNSSIYAQVDTSHLKLVVSQIQSVEDHNEFWQNLYERDQTFRGVKTSKINDFENLISAIYYLNRFGYPSEDIKAGRAMPLIWIHASYPKVEQVTFPIILAGFKGGQISEKDIRTYYVRNKHWRKYFNEENRTKDLYMLFADLNLNVEREINMKDVLTAYNESEGFLNQNFTTIGHWDNPKSDTTVKIMKSEDGEYYYHDLYADGSYYPEKVNQDKEYPNLYRNYFKPEFYFGIQPNGDLTVKNSFEKRTLKPIEKNK
jgi:hypothetical protein